MLKRARERLSGAEVGGRVDFRLAYLPDASLEAGAWDAVISNSLLHHLPNPQVLWRSIVQLAAPGAAVQVMDLMRPESEADAAQTKLDVQQLGRRAVTIKCDVSRDPMPRTCCARTSTTRCSRPIRRWKSATS